MAPGRATSASWRRCKSMPALSLFGSALLPVLLAGLTAPSMVAAAPAPPARLAATPRLYVVDGPVGPERPRVYVVFATQAHLHEPRTVVAKVKGQAGRTFADRRGGSATCYRSALSLSPPANEARVAIVPGRSYRVDFVQRSSAHASTDRPPFRRLRLPAHRLHAGSPPPTCPEAASGRAASTG